MTNFYLINECGGSNFSHPGILGEQTTYSRVLEDTELPLTPQEFNTYMESLKNKNVLVLIHGLNNSKKKALLNYSIAHANTSQLVSTTNESYLQKIQRFFSSYLGFWHPKNNQPYDAVIGITWPSFDHEMYYYQAKENARLLAPKVFQHLKQLSGSVNNLDVIAHSMGNYLLFEALTKELGSCIKLRNIYSIAAAVPKDSLNIDKKYGRIAKFCHSLFVMYSLHDQALYWPFFLAEKGRHALGLTGANHHKPLASNITSVNCSQFAHHHSAYLHSDPFYLFIERNHNQKYQSLLDKHHHVRLDSSANMDHHPDFPIK